MIAASVVVCRTPTPFPKIMTNVPCGFIVLFSKPRHGIVIRGPDDRSGRTGSLEYYQVGIHQTGWDMAMFEDFTGSITLTNEKVES